MIRVASTRRARRRARFDISGVVVVKAAQDANFFRRENVDASSRVAIKTPRFSDGRAAQLQRYALFGIA